MNQLTMWRDKGLELEQPVEVENLNDAITGAWLWFSVKRDPSHLESQALIQKSVLADTIQRDVGAQRFIWKVYPEDTVRFTDNDIGENYYWDVQYQGAHPDAQPTIIDSGRFRLKQPVTHASVT